MTSLTRALRSLVRLSWRDRIEIVQIVGAALVVEVGLKCTALPTLTRLLKIPVNFDPAAVDAGPIASLPPWAIRRLVLIRTVLRGAPSGPTCLRVSLVGAQRLRRLAPTVRIGVQRASSGELLAHAWLEVGGRSVDPAAEAFLPMTRIDSRLAR